MTENSSRIEQFDNNKYFGQNITFVELQKNNVTIEMLLDWSMPIDLVERYQMFLNNISDQLTSSENELTLYDCESGWFGPFCRFGFPLQPWGANFSLIVQRMMYTVYVTTVTEMRCYEHFTCERSNSLCINWREICDGKIECFDGSDESDCWQMEINECDLNEYRCRNGQCIPKEFLNDDPSNPDCLDQSDEVTAARFADLCGTDPAFRCMEQICQPGSTDFPCGDGQCVGNLTRCLNGRNDFLISTCLLIMNCITMEYEIPDSVNCELYRETDFSSIGEDCPSFFEYPLGPILFDHVRFIYSNNIEEKNLNSMFLPEYICYDEKLCGKIYPIEIHYNNLTCRYFHQFRLNQTQSITTFEMLIETMKIQFLKCLPSSNYPHYCNHSTMYQCVNSTKCISKHRLVDGYSDCPFDDDEKYNESCQLPDAKYRFRCYVNNVEKCFAQSAIHNGIIDCSSSEDENYWTVSDMYSRMFFFGDICDGHTDLPSILINGNNVTDESECQYWQCNNTYTHCNGLWSCENGIDEFNCLPSNCPLYYQECILLNDTSKISCLPMNRIHDGIIDCAGGTDELQQRKHDSPNFELEAYTNQLYCESWQVLKPLKELCDVELLCPLSETESVCYGFHIAQIWGKCKTSWANLTELEKFFCQFDTDYLYQPLIYKFLLKTVPNCSIQTINDIKLFPKTNPKNTQSIQTRESVIVKQYTEERPCHMGVPMHVRLGEDQYDMYCLCSPGYYGDQCEYENEHISLTFQIQFSSDWENLFLFLITLIDNERNIQSYDYIDYSPVAHCDMKYNIYLIYSTRPKNRSKTYSVQIDVFNKRSLTYRSSWIYPIKYSFLPVYRLSVLLKVPTSTAKIDDRCNSTCIHGRCYNYVNSPNSTYCQCDSGWSGVQCNIKLNCHCAPDSLCLSNSICICPFERYGPRCYLNYSACHSNSCLNNGSCITSDLRLRTSDITMFKCICPFGYSGESCQQRESQSRIEISFGNDIKIPSALLVHFITSNKLFVYLRPTSLMKKIPVDKDVISFDTMGSFHLAIAQILNDYYLILGREKEILSANISTKIHSSYRCLAIHELFNETIINQHYLQRIKLYPIPCHQKSELICFYDQDQICLCELNRHVNCFPFDHNMTYSCNENNYCQNDGQCFFNKNQCPTSSICVCKECYFGSQCQFSTKGSTLSLDIIIGLHIRQNTTINQQTHIVKLSISISIIFIILAFINSILTYLTFQMKTTHDIGCAIYLYVSSFTSLITMIIMTIKFWLVFYSQNGSITNRSFIHGQCLSFDFVIRIFLSINDWLHGCVSFDRAVNVYQGVHFNKAKSKQQAKWFIVIVSIVSICSYVHDPIHRYLVDDEEDQRTWCLTKYTSGVKIYDWIINIIHVCIPALINFISAIVIIINVTQTRVKAQKKRTFKEVFKEQFREHRHLLISALILFLLAIPRIIISFLSGCLKSPRNPWLHLIGYYIPFVPTITTFIVFVIPSETYKAQLRKVINQNLVRLGIN